MCQLFHLYRYKTLTKLCMQHSQHNSLSTIPKIWECCCKHGLNLSWPIFKVLTISMLSYIFHLNSIHDIHCNYFQCTTFAIPFSMGVPKNNDLSLEEFLSIPTIWLRLQMQLMFKSTSFTTIVGLVLCVILVVNVCSNICNYYSHICNYSVDIIK